MARETLNVDEINYIFNELDKGNLIADIFDVLVAQGVDTTWIDALESEITWEWGRRTALNGVIENGDTWKTRYWGVITPAPAGCMPVTFDTIGGEEALIFGSLFTPTDTVTLDDEPCEVLGVSSGCILVRVPAHAAGTGLTFKVKNAGNDNEAELTGGASEVAYAKKTPVFTSITPATGKAIGGTMCVILGTDFTPGMAVTIGGHAQTVLTEDSTHITFRTTAHAAGALDVVITAVNTDADTGVGAFTYI
jgi:hypothetical protein